MNGVPCTVDVQARCSACNVVVFCRIENTFVRQRRGVDISRVEGVARERLPVGQVDVRDGGEGRTPRRPAVGTGGRLSVGRRYVRARGNGREPRGAAVGMRQRLPVGRADVFCGRMGRELDILQWARANGYPWDVNTRRHAKGKVLEWAVANGVPDESDEEDDDFDLSDSASDKKCEKSPPL